MEKRNLTIALLLSIITIFGCKKDKIENQNPKIIVDKKWKVVSILYNGKEIFTDRPSCAMDDYLLLSPNLKYRNDEGTEKCSPNDPQIKDEGVWAIEGDVLYLQSDVLPIKTSINIGELTATKMVLNQINTENNTIFVTTYTAE